MTQEPWYTIPAIRGDWYIQTAIYFILMFVAAATALESNGDWIRVIIACGVISLIVAAVTTGKEYRRENK